MQFPNSLAKISAASYPLLRALLFRLEPEAAHDLLLQLLANTQRTLLACSYQQPRVNDPIELAGMYFPNRVGLAAGLDKNASCVDALASFGFGFLELGTVTPLPQQGNPKPRVFRLTEYKALINRLGFNNHGLDVFIANLRAAKNWQHRQKQTAETDARKNTVPLGLNIGKNAVTPIASAASDYLNGLEKLYVYADYITINISSPNTKDLRQLQEREPLSNLLQQINGKRAALMQQHGKAVPLFVKLSPDDFGSSDAFQVAAKVLQDNRVDGVIATNTTLGRDGVGQHPLAAQAGGLSGAPLLQKSNQAIRDLRKILGANFPIIGVGGICTAADAVAKLQAGADLVQIYTGLIYEGPQLIAEAAQALARLNQAKVG